MKVDMIQLFISRISGLSTDERVKLYKQFPLLENLLNLNISDLEYILNRKLMGVKFNTGRILRESMKILNSVLNLDIEIINYNSKKYPPLLREIYNPPFLIYKKGGFLNNGIPAVAVVGTRKASQMALKAAFNLGLEISDYDINMVSGLAQGIDQAAHDRVVERKGSTIAVLGNGIDSIYPKSNSSLGKKIIDLGGVILSEYPPGTPPLKYNFPARNRIISGLCQSVVVIEAPEKSGALITAEFALDQGREVYIHRCSINSSKGAGCRRLLFEGANTIDSFGDLLSFKEAV
ncbi:MAG: DNA-processing protein DprA [Spirochaetales bacterium]|nr:DNA-processing protein DprA [Spirochaetales bacterium]